MGKKLRFKKLDGAYVMLGADVALLYGVSSSKLLDAVSRHPDRFPDDWLVYDPSGDLAFTAHGVLMVSTILESRQAVQTHIEIIRELNVGLKALNGGSLFDFVASAS